jgi:L-aspartate oxidase
VSNTTDILVIGSGIAGLTFALDAADSAEVTVLTKLAADDTNTRRAQGGIAAVMDPDDSPDAHLQDTLVAGAGLCHRVVVERCVREGPDRMRELIARGARFDEEDGALSLTCSGRCSRPPARTTTSASSSSTPPSISSRSRNSVAPTNVWAPTRSTRRHHRAAATW